MQQNLFIFNQKVQIIFIAVVLCFTSIMVSNSYAAPDLSHPRQQEPISEWQIYISSGDNGTVGGVEFKDEDILFFDGQDWSLFLDMSDVGVSPDITAFTLLDDGNLLFSISDNAEIPRVGTITANDIVLFTPTTTGEETTGEFTLFLRGADVGLDTPDEAIDAISLDPNGRLLISTKGKALIDQFAAGDEDLIVFTSTNFSNPADGTWTMYFDGSDVGLTTSDEDITGVWVDDATGEVYITTKGAVRAGALAGDATDVVVFSPISTGFGTGGQFKSKQYFDGSTFAAEIGVVDGLTIRPQSLISAKPSVENSEGTLIVETQVISGFGNFTFGGDLGSFSGRQNSQRSFKRLNPGVYLISQIDSPPNWSLNEISCSDPDNGSSHINKTAIVDLDAGESIKCTFLFEWGDWMPPVTMERGVVYISTKGSGKLDTQPLNRGDDKSEKLSFNKMDILSYNPYTDSWSLFFNGTKNGITEELNGLHVVPGSHILLSLDKPQMLPGLTEVVEPWDIVQFDLESGAYSRYFSGLEAGLSDKNASIDAFSLTSDGDLVISTRGTAVLNEGDLQVKDEDLILWDSELEEWRVYIDSSRSGFEADTTALWIGGSSDNRLYMASDKNFVLDGSSGDISDIFVMNIPSSDDTAVGTFGPGLYFDGSALSLGKAIDGLTIYSP